MCRSELPPETEEFSISWGGCKYVPIGATPRDGRIFNIVGRLNACASRSYPPRRKNFQYRGAVASMCQLELPPKTEEISISWGSCKHVPVGATPRVRSFFNIVGRLQACAPQDGRIFNIVGRLQACAGRSYPPRRKIFYIWGIEFFGDLEIKERCSSSLCEP